MQSSYSPTLRPAIVIADDKWCAEASRGRIRVYNFKRPRKRKIHALKPGSICVVFLKQPQTGSYVACGEFQVRAVKEVTYEEYNLLIDFVDRFRLYYR